MDEDEHSDGVIEDVDDHKDVVEDVLLLKSFADDHTRS